ncbi:hypothetical protein KI387_030095, partial [Taxus chinensis]
FWIGASAADQRFQFKSVRLFSTQQCEGIYHVRKPHYSQQNNTRTTSIRAAR